MILTTLRRPAAVLAVLLLATAAMPQSVGVPVDWEMVARIREEGLQRSRVMDYESYMTDVLGARLTLSRDMQRAQEWLVAELKKMGLANVAVEPYMDYGVAWDNEYVSLHMREPDYSPMVGYPISHTPGTEGRQVVPAVIVELLVRDDLARYRGTLRFTAPDRGGESIVIDGAFVEKHLGEMSRSTDVSRYVL
jgi:hypothetical protein